MCEHSDYKPPVIDNTPPPEPYIRPGKIIKNKEITLEVYRADGDDFTALVTKLKDKTDKHGHFGSYVWEGRYYRFHLLHKTDEDATWEVPEEGTERFHREGSTGSQFLLCWEKDIGYVVDLGS